MAESSASGDSSSSKSLLWMMIALFVGLGGLLGGGLFMANRMVRVRGACCRYEQGHHPHPGRKPFALKSKTRWDRALPIYSNASLVLPSTNPR